MNFLIDNTADRGYVYVMTPDIDSPLVPESILDWHVFNSLRHVQFFQPENLRRLFEDRGFSVRKLSRAKGGVTLPLSQELAVSQPLTVPIAA